MLITTFAALPLSSDFTVAAAGPLVYVCRTSGIGSSIYLKLDDKLKTASLGREEGKYLLTLPAIFNAGTVT